MMKTNPAVKKTPRKNPPNKMPTVDTCTDVYPCASDKKNKLFRLSKLIIIYAFKYWH